MRKLLVVLESSKARAVFDLEVVTEDAVVQAVKRWLSSAVASSAASGVCKSFGVGVHLNDADCDHETAGVGHG